MQKLSVLGVLNSPTPCTYPRLDTYDRIIVALSGGKDSIACLLYLLELGVDISRLELWHHDVDGREGSTLMDWPCTRAYCEAIAHYFRIPIYFSWREGGFEREMLRQDQRTAPTHFETPDGEQVRGGTDGKIDTRLKFPQTSANLSVRWCSAALKIDVAGMALRNQKRLERQKTLFVTGERAEESTNRAKYAPFEAHREDLRDGKRSPRHIDHWRPVHGWPESQVWAIIERFRLNPHPAYKLGWGRVSCAACIFGSANQWASLYAVMPEKVERIMAYEQEFGVTINRSESIRDRILRGIPYKMAPADIAAARSYTYDEPIVLPPGQWKLPAGAYGESDGPS